MTHTPRTRPGRPRRLRSLLRHALVAAALAALLAPAPAPAQTPPAGETPRPPVDGLELPPPGSVEAPPREGFLDLQELIRLLEVAKESGFTEEQLKDITVEDEGRLINAWEYVQEQRRKAEATAKARQERESRVYLTVKDVVKELMELEPKDLRKLRDELVLHE